MRIRPKKGQPVHKTRLAYEIETQGSTLVAIGFERKGREKINLACNEVRVVISTVKDGKEFWLVKEVIKLPQKSSPEQSLQ